MSRRFVRRTKKGSIRARPKICTPGDSRPRISGAGGGQRRRIVVRAAALLRFGWRRVYYSALADPSQACGAAPATADDARTGLYQSAACAFTASSGEVVDAAGTTGVAARYHPSSTWALKFRQSLRSTSMGHARAIAEGTGAGTKAVKPTLSRADGGLTRRCPPDDGLVAKVRPFIVTATGGGPAHRPRDLRALVAPNVRNSICSPRKRGAHNQPACGSYARYRQGVSSMAATTILERLIQAHNSIAN